MIKNIKYKKGTTLILYIKGQGYFCIGQDKTKAAFKKAVLKEIALKK